MAEDVVAKGFSAGASRTEFEMRTAGPLLSAPEGAKGIAAGSALEALKARLAVGTDLAAVVSGALLLVADNLISLIRGREMVLGLRIVRILVRMILLGQLPVGRLDFLGRGVFCNAQHLIRVAHISCLLDERFWCRALYAPA
jgi:hypothetical protein